MKRSAIFLFCFICSIAARSQVNKDSCTLEISLLTCAPGTELYSLFGHTAIRVQDLRRGMDFVYNYGTFDDRDPLFYIHFMRGIMVYSLSAETFHDFMQEYTDDHRPVVAQVLDLNCTEKNRLYEALRKNSLEENRFYNYHFHTDNCTTRAARIIEANTEQTLTYKYILPVFDVSAPPFGPSFRDMIHEYLDRQHENWSEFGIDMFLGANLDVNPTNIEAIHFLPDYLFKGMDSALDGNKPLVLTKQTLLRFPETLSTNSRFRPMVVFILFFILAILLFFLKNKRPLLIFDIIFFILLGLLGILMAAMWFGRVDDVCRNNINIIWALPLHLPAVLFIRKKTAWVKYYFLITGILATLLLIGFPWWFQRMNMAVLPLLGIIIFRSFNVFLNRYYAEKSLIQK